MTELVEFVRLRLFGGRFDASKGMPIETLPELVAYENILLRVARSIFLHDHPERQRIPKGFMNRLELRLRVIEGSSVEPLVERVPTGELIPDEFDQARDRISDLIEMAHGSALESNLLPDSLAAFNSFGKTLRADEAIEIRVPSGGRVQYTNDVRKRIVQLSGTRYSAVTSVDGFVSELDSQSHRFSIHLPDADVVVSGPYAPEHFKLLHAVMADPPLNGTPIRVEADIEYAPDDRPGRILEVSEVARLDYVSAFERIAELKTLEPGWLDGEGKAIASSALDQGDALLESLAASGVPSPGVFPTSEGGIQFQWVMGDTHISLEITDEGISLATVDVETKELAEHEFGAGDLSPVAAELESTIASAA